MNSKQNWLVRPIHPGLPAITNEVVIFIFVMIAAIITRFYDLEARVMSHDESLHTYFSWLLYLGQGYRHDPMMHGPLQFHLIALSYFLFGVSDLTARIPSVIFSLATIWMVWYWRNYIGKWGAIISGVLLVISPYMLYYGRYVRNESFAGFSGVLMLYAVLRHLEFGGKKYLYMLAFALMIHFTAKETAFIYAAQLLIYLAVYFIIQVSRTPWRGAFKDYRAFIISLCVTILFAGSAVGYGIISSSDKDTLSAMETAVPVDPNSAHLSTPEAASSSLTLILAVIAIAALLVTAYFLIRGYTWKRLRSNRAFELLFITGTIVLPQLSPFVVDLTNISMPTTAAELNALSGDFRSIIIIGASLLITFAAAITAGLIWNAEKWGKASLFFWVPFALLYTTIFTNSGGFVTGTIGSLGYWLVQHGVERGSQPPYYYLLIQIPVYEFLPALGLLLAIFVGLRRKVSLPPAWEEDMLDGSFDGNWTPEEEGASFESAVIAVDPEPDPIKASPSQEERETYTREMNFVNMFSLLAWWSVISIIAFTVAGERMPWLTYHMAWPMILITGWVLGYLIDTMNWEQVANNKSGATFAAIAIFLLSAGRVFFLLNSPMQPFMGSSLDELQATYQILLPAAVMLISAFGAIYLLREWTFRNFRRAFVLVAFTFLAILTMRASFRAAYITYDQAREFLVYAHGATGIKEVIAQVTEISERTTGGMDIALAYDASAPDTGVSWPFVWYLRDFKNQRSFDQPTRTLRESVVIIVDEKNFDKIEPAIGPGYYRMDYIRMWWPMQDYFGLVGDRDPDIPFDDNYACKGAVGFFKLFKSKDYSRFCEGFTDPAIRAGIFQIWLNRDYTLYAQAKGRSDLTLSTWQPADQMRLYVRKDVAAQIWNYGVAPSEDALIQDPTEGKYIVLNADRILDGAQASPALFNAPRSLAFSSDGTLYVADSRNHRILHLDPQGNVLHQWGTYADGVVTPIGDGTFNEPWGIAVAPDGFVYVADTWNHRIEKFTAEGRFVKAWGTFGQGSAPDAFYGPRGLAVDEQGRVYVTDTGNKRIVVFDADGNYITEFGSAGFEPGQFDEPTSVAIDKNGTVYVTDAWNQRIQTFTRFETEGELTFIPDKQWDVFGWFGQSLENKPFIAVDDDLHVFITDPESYRVIEFDPNGEIVRVWGDYGNTPSGFALASGVAVDPEGNIWVTDGSFNRIMRFTLP
ncbi:MAG: TIGR03663 family protein [Anaerolineales bacterium]|nr:TIGR03663 family protein [Anaerolineales bacterium]MCB9143875.1 TIGR03663 family protein [Anaerolineales bacterium]